MQWPLSDAGTAQMDASRGGAEANGCPLPPPVHRRNPYTTSVDVTGVTGPFSRT